MRSLRNDIVQPKGRFPYAAATHRARRKPNKVRTITSRVRVVKHNSQVYSTRGGGPASTQKCHGRPWHFAVPSRRWIWSRDAGVWPSTQLTCRGNWPA